MHNIKMYGHASHAGSMTRPPAIQGTVYSKPGIENYMKVRLSDQGPDGLLTLSVHSSGCTFLRTEVRVRVEMAPLPSESDSATSRSD